MIKLATVIKGAVAIQADSSLSQILKKTAGAALNVAERITGLQFYSDLEAVPFHSHNPANLYGPLQTVLQLQGNGLVGRIEKIPREYPDELQLHSFRIVGPDELWGSGHGVDFYSEEKALWRTVGEYAERLLWRHYIFYKNTTTGSQTSVKNAMPLDSLAGFSKKLISDTGILRFDEHTTFTWTPVTSLTSRKKVLCPVQLLSNFYTRNHVQSLIYDNEENATREPMLRWCVTTGLATGTNINDALVSGMLEVIERDAFMIMYLNKIAPEQIDTEWLSAQNAACLDILERLSTKNIVPYILITPTDFPVYAITVVLKDESSAGPAITVAASAGFDLIQTVIDALSEATAVRLFLRHALENEVEFNPEKIDQEGRLLYWAKHSNAAKLDFMLTGKIIQPTAASAVTTTNNRTSDKTKSARYTTQQYQKLVNEFKQQEQLVVYTELTSPEVRRAGLRVVKIVAPAMHPLHLHEQLPYHYSTRLSSIPKKLGLETASHINLDPHPFP